MKKLWLDLETTGLDPQQDHILEIHARADDWHFTALIAPPPDTVFSPFIVDMHTRSGLLADLQQCVSYSPQLAESMLIGMLEPGAVYHPAGNSVHFDLGFIRVHMPQLVRRLSHRCYDVTAIRMFCEEQGMPQPQQKTTPAHRAYADVLESINTAQRCAAFVAAKREER